MIFFPKKLSTLAAFLVNKSEIILHALQTLISLRALATFTNAYFYSTCCLCNAKGTLQLLICNACKADLLVSLDKQKCVQCSLPLSSINGHTHCIECRAAPPQFDKAYIVTRYEFPSSTLVHRLKYQNRRFIARLLGQLLAEQRVNDREPFPDLVCCVPMHPDKLRDKNYNHAREIAAQCAMELSLVFNPTLLIKTQTTESQSSLGRTARLKNLKNSIVISPGTNLKESMLRSSMM